MEEKEVFLLSPALLAYIGDSVYELKVRSYLLENGYRKNNQIHEEAIKFVNASFQAAVLRKIRSKLTNREKKIARRGRNSKSGSVPSGAKIVDYRLSTALEALFGYHYLLENNNRLMYLWQETENLIENN